MAADPRAAIRCDTKGCPNEPTERVPDEKLPHVVYDLCSSCAAGMRAMRGVELIDAKNVPPLTFEPVAAFASGATLYLGSHHATTRWWALGVPLFVSVRVLGKRKSLPVAVAPWALDSGGFTELDKFGRWETSETEYVEQIERLSGIGSLAWVAPQDWMCEPFMLTKTGLSVREHQERTVASFLSLRERVGSLVIPVLQGYAPREYDRCVELYVEAGVDLRAEPVVGLGSVCRRSRTREAVQLVRYLGDYGLNLHGFGLKGDTYRALRYVLVSADSMAWSYRGRHEPGCGPSHKSEANCSRFAMRWRADLLHEGVAA